MALVVGTDTYLTQVDATAYMAGHYATTDAKHIAWDALATDDKDAYLRKAAQIIDRQPLAGVKYTTLQTMAFPRIIYSEYMENGNVHYSGYGLGLEYYNQAAIPDAVKYAQVEIALSLCTGASDRSTLQREGVKQFSLGSLSETYGGVSETKRIPSIEAKELLMPYLAGGVSIC